MKMIRSANRSIRAKRSWMRKSSLSALVFALTLKLMGCASAPSELASPSAPETALELYLCGEGQLLFIERTERGEPAYVQYGALVERLRSTEKSGKYRGDTLVFYEDLGGVRLQAPEITLECTQNERVEDLRALIEDDLRFIGFGNEPFIRVLIFGDRFELMLDAGERVLKGALEPLSAAASRSIRLSLESEDERITLAIDKAPCEDTMSGARFSHRFGLHLQASGGSDALGDEGAREFEGCGFAFDLPIAADSADAARPAQ